MGSVVHFEIPADDLERAQRFYREAFGWRIEKFGETDYWMVHTREDEAAPGIDGGMMKRAHPEERVKNYIEVPSIEESAARIEKLGGKVLVPKQAIPGVGCYAVFLDTENNVQGLFQTDEKARM